MEDWLYTLDQPINPPHMTSPLLLFLLLLRLWRTQS